MSVKEMARQVIDALPDEADMEEVMYALYLRAAIEKGEKDIREGRWVSQAEAEKRIRQWAK
jgi:predicted transcriptional regulator